MLATADTAVLEQPRRARVVVIDDDPELLACVRDALADPRFELRCFTDPATALASMADVDPDLVITDLTMPALTGRDVIRHVRGSSAGGAPPILVLSGHGDEDDIVECFSLGVADYMSKPLSLPELRAKVAVLVARSIARASPTAADPVTLAAGARFGDYEILRRLGAGGMGVVYEARSPQHGLVALKVLTPELSKDVPLLRRFFREARHLKAVRHPNIVSFFDLGHEAGTYFLVMECASGEALDVRFARVLPLHEPHALAIALEIARALEALHAAQIVHRDLKPANVIVDDDGHVKLVDFGLTKRPHDEPLTDTDVLMGTPHYLSPEQITGREPIDTRTDLYALGVMLFYLLTGTHPFTGDTHFAILEGHATQAPPPLRERNPTLTAAVETLVNRLLAKHPSDRLQTPSELVGVLEALLARGT